MRKLGIISMALIILAAAIPQPVSADFALVPCGRADQKGTPAEHCTFRDLIILIVRLINYLFTAAFLVAIHRVIAVSFDLVTAMGNAQKIEKSRTGLGNAVVGFAIIIVSFMFMNLLMNALFKNPEAPRKWWEPACIYGIGVEPGDCPQGIAGKFNK